jgi:hypothetical protein
VRARRSLMTRPVDNRQPATCMVRQGLLCAIGIPPLETNHGKMPCGSPLSAPAISA